MSRGIKQKPKRKVAPDAIYNSIWVSKMINYLMLDGKKQKSATILYNAIASKKDFINSFYLKNFSEFVFSEDENGESGESSSWETRVNWFITYVINHVSTVFEVESRRVGGANYQIPTRISKAKSIRSAMVRIVQSARSRNEKTMEERLSNELSDICENRGKSVDSKILMEKVVEANRPFAHFANYA